MPISADFKSRYSKDWEIYFSQCYPNAAIKLPELANLLQLTAAEHSDKGGLGFVDLNAYDQSWVMNRMRIEIDEYPVWSDFIEISTWVDEFKGVKTSRNFEVISGGKKCVGVSTLWAVFNMKTRRPDLLTMDVSHFEIYPNQYGTAVLNRKLDAFFEPDSCSDYTVKFSDLDIVKHVNNIKYLEWCLDQLDPSFLLENRIKALDLNFVKELNLGDSVVIGMRREESEIKFKIMKEEKVCFLCTLEIR